MTKRMFSDDEIAFMAATTAAEKAPTTSITEEFQSAPDEAESFAEFSRTASQPRQEVPAYKGIPAAFLRGIPEGLLDQVSAPISWALSGTEAITGQPTSIESMRSTIKGVGEKFLPYEDNFLENAANRTGRIAPASLAGGGLGIGNMARTAGAGLVGQTLEEVNAPWWLQGLGEVVAFGLPNMAKKLIPNKSQEGLVNAAKNLGLTDAEVTPLIQSEGKKRWLSKLATKGESAQKVLKQTYDTLGRVFEGLRSRPESNNIISKEDKSTLVTGIQKSLGNLPNELRDLISKDFKELTQNDVTGKSIIKFWRDVNHHIGKGNTQLGTLKEPLQKALYKVSPQLGEDFAVTNKLYGKYADIAERLKPDLVSKGVNAAETLGLGYAVFTGNFPAIAATLGTATARQLAQKMLLNPRLQNLSSKAVSALNQSKWGAANAILDSYIQEIINEVPEAAAELQKVDFKKLGENPPEAKSSGKN